MAYPSKGLTRQFPLRMAPVEDAIIKQTRKYMASQGITLSENDTIRFLIQRAAVPDALTPEQAEQAIRMHWAHCPSCDDKSPPKCPAGVHLRDAYTRVRPPEPS